MKKKRPDNIFIQFCSLGFLQVFFQRFCPTDACEFENLVLKLIPQLESNSIEELYEQTILDHSSEIPFFVENKHFLKGNVIYIPIIVYFHTDWQKYSGTLTIHQKEIFNNIMKEYTSRIKEILQPPPQLVETDTVTLDSHANGSEVFPLLNTPLEDELSSIDFGNNKDIPLEDELSSLDFSNNEDPLDYFTIGHQQ